MNGQEQKARHHQVLALEAHMAKALDAAADRMAQAEERLNQAESRLSVQSDRLDTLADSHNERLNRLRHDTDGVIERRDALDRHFWDFVECGFWSRLGWVLFGRLPR